MASQDKGSSNTPGEILIAWQHYKASSSDELDLREGDVVELLDINDPASSAKRMKLDPVLDQVSGTILDSSAARHKLSVRPRRTYASSRHSPTRLNINARWLVREVSGGRKQGWVPCKILQTEDDPALGASSAGLPGDAAFRRQAVVKELVETEQEFVKDLDIVVQKYLIPTESGKVPKIIKNNFDVIFGNLKEIAEFHRTVLMDGMKYYANEPLLLGKAFLRLERDFDKHVHYCRDEPAAQEFLETSDEAYDYFSELSQRLGDDKSISEHLKLPIQRINDYQLLLKELVRYSACLSEDNSDLQKALELMLSVPHRAQDDKFTSSIEGYRGSIHKLGRLLAHDRFSVTFGEVSKERYLFLFKARILICKVRRISDDRSIFQLKDIIRLPQVEVKDHPEDDHLIELVDKSGRQSLILKSHRDHIKKFWLKEIREFSKGYGESEETTSDEFQIASPPTEPSQTSSKPTSEITATPKPPPKELAKPVERPKQLELKQDQPKENDSPKPKEKDQTKPVVEPPKSLAVEKPKQAEVAKVTQKKVEESPKRPEVTSPITKLPQRTTSSTKTAQSEETTTQPSKKLKVEEQPKEVAAPKLVGITKSKQQDDLISELKKKAAVATKKETSTSESSTLVAGKVTSTTVQSTSTTTDIVRQSSETLKQVLTLASDTSKEEAQHHLQRIKAVEPVHPVEPSKKSSSSSEDSNKTLIAETVSDTETLKQVQTPESDFEEQGHLKKLAAVEPLIQINKPRVLEEKVEYIIKPPPERVPGSALNKVLSIEHTGPSDTVLTDFKVGVEFNVEVGNDMSRRYTSSARDGGGYESSYSRRTAKSSYSSDPSGITSSRYNTESSANKYGTDSALTGGSKYDSKYDSLTSKYSTAGRTPYSTDLGGDSSALSSSYSRKPLIDTTDDSSALSSSYSRKPLTDTIGDSTGLSSSYTRKPLTETTGDNNEYSSSYSSRRSLRSSGVGDGDGDTYSYSRRLKTKTGDDEPEYTSSYSKRSSRTITSSADGDGEGDGYYSKRTLRGSLEATGEGDKLNVRKSIRSMIEGTGIEPSDTGDSYSYSTKRSLGSEIGSKYSRRSISAEGSESSNSKIGSNRMAIQEIDDDTEDLIKKYSPNYVRGDSTGKRAIEEEEDKYAKYSRKYSTDRKTSKDEDTTGKYSRRFSRNDSTEPKSAASKVEEEDAYEKYARKYLRKEESSSAETKSSYSKTTEGKENKGLEEDDAYSRYTRKYSRNDSQEADKDDREVSSTKLSSETTSINGKQLKSESYESKQTKSESYQQESKSESYSKESSVKEIKAEQVTQVQDSQATTQVNITNKALSSVESQNKSQIITSTTNTASSANTASAVQPLSRKTSATESVSAIASAVQSVSRKASTAESASTKASTAQSVTRKASTADSVPVISSTAQSVSKTASVAQSSPTKVPAAQTIQTMDRKASVTDSNTSASTVVARRKSSTTSASSATASTTIVSSQGNSTMIKVSASEFQARESSSKDSISMSMKTTREKSAEEKLDEIEDGRPKFVKTIRGTSIEPGETAQFEVLLNEKADSFVWLKDSKPLNENASMSGRIQEVVSDNGEERRLLVKLVKNEDAGIYTAIAQNKLGKSSCSAQLIVEELSTDERADRAKTDKPEFLVSMKDAELLEDTYLRFMVKVVGEPNPDISFFKDGKKIQENQQRLQVIREHSDKGFYELVIPEVKKADAGVYKCVATNKFGEACSEATVTVTDNKEIYKEMPEGEILPSGEKPVFHWRKDGTNFEPDERFKVLLGDDEDSLALVFQHVKPDDVGLYTCVAQTSRGHISCSAELTVHGTVNQLFREPEKPKLIIEKKEPIVTAGNQAMLELQVKGYPKPQVRWTHEGKPIEASSKYKFLYEDEETMSLIIKDVRSEDAGKYHIYAENELGSDSAEMNLTVKAPPKIKNKMEDISIHTDQLLKMTVEIEGIPKPKVQFYKDGKEIKQSERVKIAEEMEKYSLVVEKTSLKDTGSYSVVATNELAQVSQFWNLDVYSKPKILEKLGADKQVAQGENVELKVKIESEPKAQVKWYKDEEEVQSSEHFVVKEDGDMYILRITGAVTTDAAKYKFKAFNIHGTGEDEVRVDVKKAPKIIQGLDNMTVTEYDKNVTFDIKMEAFPKPTVKWYLDEVEIQETRTEFTRMESDDGVKLVIKEVTSELSGQYTCKLSNEVGAAETSAKLTVNCAPRILKHLKDTTVEEGATLHLEVEVGGCPPPTVKWLRNGREVSADARIKISRDTHRQESFYLDVDLIKYEEQGEYEVIVTNALGTVSSKSYVTVHKVTHTDAIEETEEEPKQMKIKVIEEEPQVAKKAEKKEKEEKQPEEPQTPVVEDVPEAEGPQQGRQYEKGEVKIQQSKIKKTPEPIVEEPTSPQGFEKRRGISATIEEIDEFDDADESAKPRHVRVEELSQSKSKKGRSLQIEEIEIVEDSTEGDRQSKPVKVTELDTDKKLKRGISATKEAIEIGEDSAIEPKSPEPTNVELKLKQRAVAATKEDIEIIEDSHEPKTPEPSEVDASVKVKKAVAASTFDSEDVEATITKYDVQDNTGEPKKSSSKAKLASIETAEVIESDDGRLSARKQKEEAYDRQESQKGKKDYGDEEDEDLEELLRKAKKQRSLVEEIAELPLKSEEELPKARKPQAEPMILDTNMKDGSRPESLDITYIIHAFANPPPVATWTLDGKEIKPDGHLRMTASQNGEEFKLEIKKLELRDAGVYECTLTNLIGAVKQRAVLEVTPEKDLRRPKIKEALKDQTIVKKNSVTYKAVIIGDPVPEVTWYKDGKPITNQEFEKDKIILESEDREIDDDLKECSFSLTIPRCERSNAGNYSIKAANKWGECESSAQLTIVLRPEIEGPEDVKVVPGEATEFTIVVQANPEPQVIWTKDDRVIQASNLISIVEDKATETYKLIFHNVQLSDEGYYKVIAKNDLGESSSEARLKTITERPKFITGLNDDQVEDQGEITLMVRADGLPKPSIRWFLNGKQIVEDENHKIATQTESQVTSTLIIKNYGLDDIGIYKATATNVVGEADTAARVAMVQTPPSFGKKLDRNEDVNEGEPLELKAKINGSPKPKVTWFKDGEPVSPDDDRIRTTVLPDGTVKLNIDNCKPSDSGAYKLVLKNPNGETACLCAVAVAPKQQRPKFLKCFKDAKVPIGQELRLEAIIEAYPPPEVKWLKDGVPVRGSSNIHLENYPDGRIALVVDVMKPENAGKYEVVLKNKLGETSAEAKIQTEKKPVRPEFTKRLMPQTVVEGFPVKFEVKAVGFPAPQITWLRNGAEIISDNKHVKIVNQPDGTSSLVIDACDEMRDCLTYKAVARNDAGEAETAAPLTVQSSKKDDEPEERPMFLHSLKDVITDEGQPLILEAPFTGNPIPTVLWTKDGEPIEPSDRVLMTCDGRRVGLKIDKSLPSDAGIYGVTLENPFGTESTQGKATVHKVFMPPKFTQRFTDLQQLPGNNAKFPCRVTGVPQPEVTWSKDGEPIGETDKYHIKRDGDMCCLYVANCEPSDAGIYRATAVNPEGQDVCTASLEVVKQIKSPKKIEPPTFLKRIGDTELFKGMTAKFTACATGIPEPDVEWFHNDKKIYPSKRIRMDKDTNGLLRLSILGVDQDDIGKYSCKISNEHGSDICHANLKFDEGLEAKPKRPVTDQYSDYDKYKRSGAPVPISDPPIISQMTDRHCTLSWKPSIPSGPREPVTYQLEMCELPSGDWFTVRSGIRSCTCGVRNLEPFRNYKFRIRVENKYGISDPSPYAVTHREKLEPDLPKFKPYLPPELDFRPETSPYFPKDFDIERPPHDGMAQAPVFLRQEHPVQYGVKEHNSNLFWFVYGYPKPKITFYFNDEIIEPGGRFDSSYTRNGQATLFVNKMLERDVGWYEAVARNEHGEARQRVRLEIAEAPYFIRRPEIEYVMVRGRAKFEARVIGVPYPEIKWYRDWKPVAASTRIKILFTEPDVTTLIINDVIYKDEGLYSCSARNVAGSASSSAMLHVEDNDHEYSIRTYSNLSPCRPHKRLYTDFYDIGDELGRGTQGVTYHAVERLNGRNYAAKIMHGRGDLRPFMYNELDILNQLRHKKLISLRDAYETDDSLGLILELASGGELVGDHLLRQDYYTESDIAGFMRQLLQGLEYMHEKGFGHMGLNLGDLLLAHPGGDDLKITDFSLSRRVSIAHLYPLLFGMPEYVSPECTNNDGVGLGHDMWSVGIITYILLSGRSPFRGENDRETLTRIREGKWIFDEDRWSRISVEAKDFISNLLVYKPDGRLDVHAALKHPWLEKADKRYQDEYQISSRYLADYWKIYREWMDNASCRNWFRRRPLEGAFTHPSKMVYPPGERYTPRATPAPLDKTPRTRTTWEDHLPQRSPLNYEIGIIKSESHYQNGPDTYLLQLRDVDFPCRLREYMKVAVNRGPGSAYILSDDRGYDWSTPIIRERRRFTDIMDEEIDDERKTRINRYGTSDVPYIRRLKHELGSRLDTYVEAQAFLESKQEGRLPFFREKPQLTAMMEGKDLELTCLAVGEPMPIVQWFKNDSIAAESHRIKIFTDGEGRSHYRLTPALTFDQGMYKIVARNKIGQTIARTRIVLGLVPDEPDSPEPTKVSDTEVLLVWKQPKHDGNSAVICYKLEYKLADDTEWTKKADNIDHEFYLIRGLEPNKNYIFRLAARNAIGWSDPGVPSAPVETKSSGAPKIQLTMAMSHLQEITDSGKEVEEEKPFRNNYKKETEPVDWEHSSIQEHYNFISEISRGKFSTVLKAVDKRTDDVVVTKVIDISDQQKKDEAEGEFAALRSLRHERIASLLAAYHSQDKAVFVLEKLQGADILTYLASKHEYTEQTVATVVTQILDGLQYLHWRGLCHLDLQPDNVVMCGVRSVQVKLVDLGSAHRVTKLGTKVPVLGHPDYMAPEVIAEEPAIPQTDIWSVGVLTYVMLSGTVPFRGQDEHESRQNTLFVRYRFENLYQEVSQEATRFLMLLFKRQPNKRPTPEECHENRWLLPTDYMIKKRERAIFLGHRIKEYSEEYHSEREEAAQASSSQLGGQKLLRSHSIQEELLTAP